MIATKGVYHMVIPVNDVERPTARCFYFFEPYGNLLQLYAPPKQTAAS